MSRRLAGWASTVPTRRALASCLGLVVLTACSPGEGNDVDPEAARTALEDQRAQVRDLVAGLATGAAEALDGRVTSARGRYEGCTSVFPEGHRDFRYVASARVDAGPAAEKPLLTPLEAVLRDAGLDPAPGERPGGQTLGASADGVDVSFSELPDQGRYVLLDASGPCVEVPADQRDRWEGRTDETPIVG